MYKRQAVLFNLVLKDAIRKFTVYGCVNVGLIQTCTDADDVVLIASNRQSLTQVFGELKTMTEQQRLRVNFHKNICKLPKSTTGSLRFVLGEKWNVIQACERV